MGTLRGPLGHSCVFRQDTTPLFLSESLQGLGVGPVLSGGPSGHFAPGLVLSPHLAVALSWGGTVDLLPGRAGGADADMLGSDGAGSVSHVGVNRPHRRPGTLGPGTLGIVKGFTSS